MSTPSPAPKWLLNLVSAATGFAIMGTEMAVGRLMAPYFGTSTMVWALLIGAVMVSLAIGHAFGGRLSRHAQAFPRFGWILLASSACIVALPLVGRPLMQETLTWFRGGSFAMIALGASTVLGLLALPITVLGMAGPVLIQEATRHSDHVANETGTLAGRLYVAGTLGSLVGTYLGGVALVPLWGTTKTLFLCAFVVAGVALLTLGLSRTRTTAASAGLALLFGFGVLTPAPPVKSGPRVLYEGESAYNYIQVKDHGNRVGLYLNDGYAVQSWHPKDGGVYLGTLWRYYGAAAMFTTTGAPKNVLILGLGGGGSARIYKRYFPDARITGVEIDPEVVRVGRKWMGLPDDVHVHTMDARRFLATTQDKYDVILLDAFDFPYVPFQLTTREFFEEVRAHLADGGALVVNAGRSGDDHRVVDAIAKTLSTVFPRTDGVDVGRSNTILVATAHPRSEDVKLHGVGLTAAQQQTLSVKRPRPWDAGDAPVLTDDRAPVEWLTDRVILDAIF